MSISALTLSRFRASLFLRVFALVLLCCTASASSFVSAQTASTEYALFTQRDGLANNFVTDIAFGANNVAWIATINGVTRIDGHRWTTFTREHGLGDSFVNAIAVAPDGHVWFATQSGGLSVFDGQKFTTYYLDNSPIPSNFLTALAVDSKGIVWVATLGNGVARFDPKVNRWTRYSLPNNLVDSIRLDASDLPHALTDGGAFRFDGQAWKTVQLSSLTQDNSQLAARLGIPQNHIRVLKTDAQGRIWIGTTQGLYVPSEVVDSIRLAPPLPVVLVHGWTGPASDKIEDSEFRYLQNYATQDGIPVFYAEHVDPKNTLYQNAENLRDDIAQVKKETGADKVNVIGFSMGGLNTRAYLESALYANDINRVIIIGTPHQGEEIWYPLLVQLILRNPAQPSGYELTPEGTQLFEATHSPRTSVPYDLLAGDARQQSNLDFLSDLPASDALVSVFSALGLDAPNVHKTLDSDLHAFEPTAVPFDLTSFLYPQNTYEHYLRNALRDNTNAPLGSEISVSQSLTLMQPAPRNHTPIVGGTIRAGETVTRPVYIDANRTARFIAYYPGGKFDFSLSAPDGQKYTNRISFLDNATNAVTFKADIASFTAFSIKNAPVGTWLLTLTRTDNGNDAVDVLTYADLDASAQMNLTLDENTLHIGDSATLRATISDHTPNLTVRAQVTDPNHNAQDIELFDDGAHGDDKPNDGIYANSLPLATSGQYVVVVSATDAQFERGAEMTFPVASDAAKLKGVTEVVKADDGLTVRVRVNVKNAGQYAIGATLRTPDSAASGKGLGNRGNIVARLSTASLTLAPGEQIVPILFPARDLRARGLDGPYVLDLVLMDTQGAALTLDEQLGAFTTPAYNAADFGSP